jgi:hypothetical protein
LQAGARELSYSSTPPENAKSLISRIENFLIHGRDDRFAFLLPLEDKAAASLHFVQERLSRKRRARRCE